MRKLVVLSGLSGSGKSWYAGKLLMEYVGETGLTMTDILMLPKGDKRGTSAYCSADMFFVGEDGTYKHDPSKIGAAHGACFKECIRAMQAECEIIIVDNTNTTEMEISPYMLAAQAYGYEAEIITLHIPVLFACERNVHKVPEAEIQNQFNQLQARKLAPWWKNTDVQAEGFTLGKRAAHNHFGEVFTPDTCPACKVMA